MHHEAS
ncbi:hypothetical protein VCHC41A1_2970, partial [Vibrio cholerae HC-41A1]